MKLRELIGLPVMAILLALRWLGLPTGKAFDRVAEWTARK